MSYTIPIFETLCKSYPTWTSLEMYLTSPEGGTIRCVGEGKYRILRYTKGTSDLSVPHAKWMRSVIWDTERHVPICVAPPKAEKGEVPVTGDSLLVQDYMDGMMINVFRSSSEPNGLQVTTRSQIGANGKFYSDKTFAEMFDEALKTMKFTYQDILKWLGTDTFASFMLQHPEHRVVARCRSPHLWLIHTGSVSETGTVTISESGSNFPESIRLPSHTLPKTVETTVLQNPWFAPKDTTTWFTDLCTAKGWFYQGVTMKDGKGNRWRMRNPNYLYLRSLRGSEATPVERFLRLRNESKVSEYLKHYGEDRQTFWDFEQTLRKKTQEVFQSYCDVHKSHSKKFEELQPEVKPCVFKLHAHYLTNLRPISEKVYMKHVVELVNNLPLYEQKRLLVVQLPV